MRGVRSPNNDTLKVGPRSLSKGISYRSSLSATRTHSLPFTMLRVASYNSSTLKKPNKKTPLPQGSCLAWFLSG